MEKVYLHFKLFGPEVILTSSVHILLAGRSHTASVDIRKKKKKRQKEREREILPSNNPTLCKKKAKF